jgi:hypothetical protein
MTMKLAPVDIAPIDSPALWRGAEIQSRTDWIHPLNSAEVADIEANVRAVRSAGIGIADIDKKNFPLETLQPAFSRALESLEHGCGMFLFRGLPALRLNKDDMRLVYWAFGRHLGTAVAQSSKGDVLGDVRDLKVNDNKLGRGYQNSLGQPFHTDSCDVVGLMVLRTARDGGLSKIASSVAIHNEILRTRPDILEVLYQPMDMYTPDRGEKTWKQPMFANYQGHFCCKTVGLYARMAQQRFPELPRLTPLQIEGMDYFQKVAERPDIHFSMMFQPGDLQLLNNHVTVHGRTGYVDFDVEDQRRHLLRLWLSVPNSRPLSPLMAEFFGDPSPGAVRGGYESRSGKMVFESLVE